MHPKATTLILLDLVYGMIQYLFLVIYKLVHIVNERRSAGSGRTVRFRGEETTKG